MAENSGQGAGTAPGEGAFGLPIDGEEAGDEARVGMRRDRLLAALTLIAGIGLALGTPFALKAGAEFFLPTTAALVIAIALVPVLEWLERHRVPSALAALTCVLLFLVAANIALAAIIVPATEFFRKLPDRIDRIQMNIAPVLDLYSSLEKYVNRTVRHLASPGPVHSAQTTAVAPPSSILELAATSAPTAIVQIFFGILVVYFFLSGWTRLRRRTITIINLSLGLVIAFALWLLGMPYPLMWGGIVALFNYIPYFGPIVAAMLLALGGLMTFPDIWVALLPAAIMIGAHLLEANAITPFIVGHRLTINPIMILISLSFWGWVWGTPGALLAVPLLIIIQTIIGAAGKPDIAGFLFEHGTLTQQRRDRRAARDDAD